MSQSFNLIGNKEKIRRGLPVSVLGLNLYPIRMSNYEEFLICKQALTLRISTLPVKYISKDFFSAIFSYEMDVYQKERKKMGILSGIMRLFQLSLRIEGNESVFKKSFQYQRKNGEIVVEKLNVTQDKKNISITPFDFSTQIRSAMAELNGVDLPDESENLDLVIANEQKKELNAGNQNMNINTDDLIASVAYQSGCREKDICDWTVREFELRRSAIDRDKRFMLFGQAEIGGMVTFKKGNPNPSWCYDLKDDNLGTQSISELNFGNATQKQN